MMQPQNLCGCGKLGAIVLHPGNTIACGACATELIAQGWHPETVAPAPEVQTVDLARLARQDVLLAALWFARCETESRICGEKAQAKERLLAAVRHLRATCKAMDAKGTK